MDTRKDAPRPIDSYPATGLRRVVPLGSLRAFLQLSAHARYLVRSRGHDPGA